MNHIKNSSIIKTINITQVISNVMKSTMVSLLVLYQKFISPLLKQILGVNNSCRFYPTCSDYAKITVKEKGIFVGLYLATIRLLKCQPFYSPNRI